MKTLSIFLFFIFTSYSSLAYMTTNSGYYCSDGKFYGVSTGTIFTYSEARWKVAQFCPPGIISLGEINGLPKKNNNCIDVLDDQAQLPNDQSVQACFKEFIKYNSIAGKDVPPVINDHPQQSMKETVFSDCPQFNMGFDLVPQVKNITVRYFKEEKDSPHYIIANLTLNDNSQVIKKIVGLKLEVFVQDSSFFFFTNSQSEMVQCLAPTQ